MPKQRNYIFKLYPDEEQAKKLDLFIGHDRFIHNKFIGILNEHYKKNKKNLSFFELNKKLLSLKKEKEYEFLYEAPRSLFFYSVIKLHNHFSSYILNNKPFPCFKKKGFHNFFSINQDLRIEGDKIKIPKVGLINFKKNKEMIGDLKEVFIFKRKASWVIKIQMLVKDIEEPEAEEYFYKTFKFKIRETKKQREQIEQHLKNSTLIWNYLLQLEKTRELNNKKRTSYFSLAKEAIIANQEDNNTFLKNSSCEALKGTVKDLVNAFSLYDKHRKDYQFPKIKKQALSFTIQRKEKIINKKINIPKIGFVRFFYNRKIEGKMYNFTVKKDANSFYLFIKTKIKKETVSNNKPNVGIDLGTNNLVATSNGKLYTGIKEDKRLTIQTKKIQKQLTKKKEASNNQEKLKIKLFKLYKRATDKKNDYRHKVTTEIAREYKHIVMEDLDVVRMTKSSKNKKSKKQKNYNRCNRTQGWGALKRQIKYKTDWNGGSLDLVDPAYTSQTCSDCGYVNPKNRDKEEFLCLDKECGHVDHADINAAKNILAIGLPLIEARKKRDQNNPRVSGVCFQTQTY